VKFCRFGLGGGGFFFFSGLALLLAWRRCLKVGLCHSTLFHPGFRHAKCLVAWLPAPFCVGMAWLYFLFDAFDGCAAGRAGSTGDDHGYELQYSEVFGLLEPNICVTPGGATIGTRC